MSTVKRNTAHRQLARATALMVLAGAVVALPGAGAAQAEPERPCPRCEVVGDGGADGSHLEAEVGIQVHIDGEQVPGSDGDGNLTSADPDWRPPACWYEPSFTPEELADQIAKLRTGGFIRQTFAMVYDLYYNNENGPYQNYNLEQQGEGVFYSKVVHPDRDPDDPEVALCDRWPFFVEFGEDPGDERAVNPRIMAEYAYDRVPIPATAFDLSPSGTQKVNMHTWIWSDAGHFRPVSATATLPGTPYEVTTTATPTALRIDPGTGEADLHMPPGGCVIRADGSIGDQYTSGRQDDVPPCGVTYLRSTTNRAAYDLTASITWEVSWTDNVSGQTHSLPDGVFETTRSLTVEEVQTIVR
jgi:enoyl reductase